MSVARRDRSSKRQLGQFLTPELLAAKLVDGLDITEDAVICEPGFGTGAFLFPVIDRLMAIRPEIDPALRFERILTENLYGAELDAGLYQRTIDELVKRYGPLPAKHNLANCDFFDYLDTTLPSDVDIVVGNPPFGGSFNTETEDALDRRFGTRDGLKIKKETYAFFIVASAERLVDHGRLRFICSDTFITISTMKGLREFLLNRFDVTITALGEFSEETDYPMVIIDLHRRATPSGAVTVNGETIKREWINLSDNRSWAMTGDLVPYFTGKTVGDYLVATSGMTTGNNALFVRNIVEGAIAETFDFEFYERAVSVTEELSKARLGRVGPKKLAALQEQERIGATIRNVRVVGKETPVTVTLPDKDYCYYNSGAKGIVYVPPSRAIYWKDDGDAVLTFKRTGKWYLRGVGGMRYFGREGITWSLISDTLDMRYLPAGYILDSGAPAAFLRAGVDSDELWFILGWALTTQASRLLKTVINHTRNIQSKDVERLPYPSWVSPADKASVVARVRRLVAAAQAGAVYTREHREVTALSRMFALPESP